MRVLMRWRFPIARAIRCSNKEKSTISDLKDEGMKNSIDHGQNRKFQEEIEKAKLAMNKEKVTEHTSMKNEELQQEIEQRMKKYLPKRMRRWSKDNKIVTMCRELIQKTIELQNLKKQSSNKRDYSSTSKILFFIFKNLFKLGIMVLAVIATISGILYYIYQQIEREKVINFVQKKVKQTAATKYKEWKGNMYKRIFGEKPEERVEENKESKENEEVKKSMFSRMKDKIALLKKNEKNVESKVV